MRDNHRDVFLPEEINRPETELAQLKALMECGHPQVCWVGSMDGTPIPIPEKKFRGEGLCEYCGSQIDFCAAGEYCTNKNCGYVDGWYNQRKTVEGHCTVCAELSRREAEARAGCAALLTEMADMYENDVRSPISTDSVARSFRYAISTDAAAALAEHDVIVHKQGFDAGFEGAERAAFERERDYVARYEAALAEEKRKARLEMRERTALRVQHQADQLKQHYQSGVVGLGWADLYELAENIRATPLETDAELRAEKEQ